MKLDTRLLLPLYKQCREIAKEEKGKTTLYCGKVAPLFEQRLKSFGIKLTNDNKSGKAGILTQWYMSMRFSWVFHIAIVRDNKRIYKEVFDAPGNITAREFLTHLWNILKAWNKSLVNNTATTNSSQPVRPVQPAKPAQPVRTVQPAQPAQPAPPVQPPKPAQADPPVKPAQATKPAQPETLAPVPPEPQQPPKRIEVGDIAQAEAQNDELMDLLLENLGEDEN